MANHIFNKSWFIQLMLISIPLFNVWITIRDKSAKEKIFGEYYIKNSVLIVFINMLLAFGTVADMLNGCKVNKVKPMHLLPMFYGFIWILVYIPVLYGGLYNLIRGHSPRNNDKWVEMSKQCLKVSFTCLSFCVVTISWTFLISEYIRARKHSTNPSTLLPTSANDQESHVIGSNLDRTRRFYPAYPIPPINVDGQGTKNTQILGVEENFTGNMQVTPAPQNNDTMSHLPSYDHLEAEHQFSNPPKYNSNTAL